MQDVVNITESSKNKNKWSIMLVPIIIFGAIVSFVIVYNIGVNIGNIIHYLLSNTSC